MIPAVGAPQANSGGGGSDLPPVTTDDNGYVLTVVNGAWDKAAPSGGGGNLVVTIAKTVDGDTTTYTTDKTAGEIKAALEAGQIVTIPYASADPFTGATVYNVAIMGGVAIEGAAAVTFDYKEGDGFSMYVDASIANSTEAITMLAATENDYPYAEEGGK